MNIFKQYGIREVADVTFYSITRIGTEEFYVPVLYLDTLKISQMQKSATSVEKKGGKGNGKILAWNFTSDISFKVEDALFSQASMNMYMNGRVMAKLSDWTSAIAKLSVANKYGQKNYSIRAFPSPTLTPSEWEIVFRCAQKAGFDPIQGDRWQVENRGNAQHNYKYLYNSEGQDEPVDIAVAENRQTLIRNYYERTQPTPRNQDLSIFFDYNREEYESLSIILREWDKETELDYAQQVAALEVGDIWGGWIDLQISYRKKQNGVATIYKWTTMQDNTNSIIVRLHFSLKKTIKGCECLWAYISADSIGQPIPIDPTSDEDKSTSGVLAKIFTGFNKEFNNGGSSYNINATYHIGNEFFLSHILYFIFPNYLEDAIGDLCWCDLRNTFQKAMPAKIIDEISREITTYKQIIGFENDLYEIEEIERMEKCVVDNPSGLKIDLLEQLNNIKEQAMGSNKNLIIFYDSKTMLPFVSESKYGLDSKLTDQKCVRIYGTLTKEKVLSAIRSYLRNQYDDEWINSISYDDYVITQRVENFSYENYDSEEVSSSFQYYGTDRDNPLTAQNITLIYFKITKREYIYLKPGTVYYKWTKTIDEDVTENTYLGTNMSIDIDSLQGEYLIVGETKIRERNTHKDERYQILIPRATLTPSVDLNLQPTGEPSVFDASINILVPYQKDRAMIELRSYKIDKDLKYGGTKIVPQNKKHSYTPTMEVIEEIIQDNKEIY